MVGALIIRIGFGGILYCNHIIMRTREGSVKSPLPSPPASLSRPCNVGITPCQLSPGILNPEPQAYKFTSLDSFLELYYQGMSVLAARQED